jgi:ribosome-associated protein
LDLRHIDGFCDYFVIASAGSIRQTNAVAEAIEKDLGGEGKRPLVRPAPGDESGWVVLDFVSVVAHIFYKPLREFYSLERLWSDAKRVRIQQRSR